MAITQKSFEYTWDEIIKRIGLSKDPLFSVEYGKIKIQGNSQFPKIRIFQSSDDHWHKLIELKTKELCWAEKNFFLPNGSETRISESLPIMFPNFLNVGNKWIDFNNQKYTLEINFDLIAACFFMLSRWEEAVVSDKDHHGRFPAESSVAFKQSFLDQPVVDEYALVLRSWMLFLVPGLEPDIPKPVLLPTHDIDFLNTFSNPWKVIDYGLKEMKSSGLIKGFNQVRRKYTFEKDHPEETDYLKSIEELALFSRELSLKGIFFFQATKRTAYDNGYDINSPHVDQILRFLKDHGQHIGLHSSYASWEEKSSIKNEISNLSRVAGQSITKCRQHYLRFNIPDFWHREEENGITEDYSMGYASQPGFRAGTCHPFQIFDFIKQEKINLTIHPLVLMDTTLKNYQNQTINEARNLIFNYAEKCHRVGGEFSILWHNTSLSNKWQDWGVLYKEALSSIRSMFC